MDFRIKVQADLDAKNFTSQLNALKNKNIKIPIKLDIQNSDLKSFASDINKIAKNIKLNVDTSGVSKAKSDIQQLSQSAKQIRNFEIKLKTQDTTAELSKLKSQIDKLATSSFDDKQKAQINSLQKSYTSLSETLSNLESKSKKGTLDSSDIEKYNTALKTTQNQMKILQNELSGVTTANQRMKFTSDMENWLRNNTKCTKQAREEIENYINQVKTLGATMTKGEFGDIQSQFKSVTSEMLSQGKVGKSWANDFTRAFKQIFQFAGVYGLIQNVAFEVPHQMLQSIKDINVAQIELIKVSDAPSSQLSSYWNEAAASAKKYGATISDVINSTADYSRLGYTLDQAKKLSDATTLLQKVGDNMTQESSSSGIISTLRGFQLDASEVTRIIDSVNQVANTKPIDTSGIFAGLERSASSMDAANNSLEQTIALITAANSVVQDPDSVGTAFKTISMRIRGATTELEDAGLETDGMAESTAKLREEIQALSGVDIMQDENTFKSTYDILDALSSKWQDLTDIQQASITELIAGKRQGNIVSALMSNFDLARDTLNTAENESQGSAERELQNYQKGIEYSLDKMKATFQEFSTTVISSDAFKGMVDMATSMLDIFTQVVNTIGIIPTILGGAGITAFIKNLD